jgi:predicted AlkP superfamily phosphohydrolase/phosphomutase
VNHETGQPIVTGFQYPQRVHSGRRADTLPDMTVEWDRSRPIRVVRSPRVGVIEPSFVTYRTGDHQPEGLLFVVRAGLAPGELDRAIDVADLAPTILTLLGVAPDGLDGRPVPELVGRPGVESPAPLAGA